MACLKTVNSESTVCGPSEDYPGGEDLFQLKEGTRDARAHLASFAFSAKKIDVQVLVSVFFLIYSDTDPGTASTFSEKNLSITTIFKYKTKKI